MQALLSILLFLIPIIVKGYQKESNHQSTDFTNQKVNRIVKLQGNIVRITNEIVIKSEKIDPSYSYKFPILKNHSDYLIYLNVKIKSDFENEEVSNIKLKQINSDNDMFNFYEIGFKSEPMNNEEERIVIIEEHYFKKHELLPKKIGLKEDQLLVMQDTVNHISFYPSKTQHVEFHLHAETANIMYLLNKALIRS